MQSFKGVMLCNRPAQIQGSLQAKTGSNANIVQKPSFVSTVLPNEQVGLNPIPQEYPEAPRKELENDVTFRHKKWLEEFQDRRDEMTNMLVDEELDRENKLKRFQEKQAEKRAAIRAVKNNNGDEDAIKRAFEGSATAEDLGSHIVEEYKEQESEPKSKAKSNKPKWAMTEEEAEDADDAEIDDLLDFANNLDYDSYIDDMEVKEALKFIHKRVQELESGMPPDEDLDLTEDEKESRRLQWEHDKRKAREVLERTRQKWIDQGNEPLDEDWGLDDTAAMSARDLMDKNGNLRQVHSTASVEKLMEKTSLRVEPPVVAVTNIRGEKKKDDPSNLPYLHRNPAV